MKRILSVVCVFLLLCALALPALAELVYGPWEKLEDNRWQRTVSDGKKTGVQSGRGPDAEHIKGYIFYMKDPEGKADDFDSYYPNGELYYHQIKLEDGTKRSEFYKNGQIDYIWFYKNEGDRTSIRTLRPDGTLKEERLYQGNEHTLDFVRLDGKLYNEQEEQYAYWEMLHVGTNEQGGWERRKTTWLMDGRLIHDEVFLYPDPNRAYRIADKEYTEDGRLIRDAVWNFYDNSYRKRELVSAEDGSFTTIYFERGPKPDEMLMEDRTYHYTADAVFVGGEAYNPQTKEKEPVTVAPENDPLRDGWLKK